MCSDQTLFGWQRRQAADAKVGVRPDTANNEEVLSGDTMMHFITRQPHIIATDKKEQTQARISEIIGIS